MQPGRRDGMAAAPRSFTYSFSTELSILELLRTDTRTHSKHGGSVDKNGLKIMVGSKGTGV